ncbi:unnamed protein product, partial [marine sediment metagenome]
TILIIACLNSTAGPTQNYKNPMFRRPGIFSLFVGEKMSETETKAEGQKAKTSKLAIVSLIFISPFVLRSVVRLFRPLFYVPSFLMLPLVLVSIVMAGIALYQIKKSNGRLKGKMLVVVVTVGIIFSFVVAFFGSAGPVPYLFRCEGNLRSLKRFLYIYSYDNEDRYPRAEKWRTGERCSYAINPNCEPNSPPDMVLLFETKGGWNQHGGTEIVSTENHPYERDSFWGYKITGCNILFNDGHVEFVRLEQIGDLKWEVEQKE